MNFENIMRTEVRQYDVKCHDLLNLRHVKSHHSLFIIRTSKCLFGTLFGGPASGQEWGSVECSARRVGFCACVNAIQD